LKRNNHVALYGIGGEYTDKILHYEVDIIYTRADKYGAREHIANNDTFGRDRSRCYIDKATAYKYYDKLTRELMAERNLSQGVPTVIVGIEENDEVLPEYQFV
jgi:hypothetical protein